MARRESRLLDSIPFRSDKRYLESIRHLRNYTVGGAMHLEVSDTHANIITAHLEVLYTEYARLEGEKIRLKQKLDHAVSLTKDVLDELEEM